MGRAYYKCTLRFSSTSNVTDTVFELSVGAHPPSEKFSTPPPRRSADAALPYERLCVGSAESEDQQVRSRHLVQVQSPVSTALKLNNKTTRFRLLFYTIYTY